MTYIKEYKCVVTGSTVPAERAKFLLEMGVSDDELTIASVSPIRRVRIPTGKCEFGVSDDELNSSCDGKIAIIDGKNYQLKLV